mgnify:FL=1
MEIFYKNRRYYPPNIILCIDLFGAVSTTNPTNRFAQVLENTNSFVYRIQTISNMKLAEKSLEIIRQNRNGIVEYANVKYSSGNMGANSLYIPLKDFQTKMRYCHSVYSGFKNHDYKSFAFDAKFKEHLAYLITLPVSADVLPFVPAEGTPLLRILAELPGLLDCYERFIREIVEVYGGVWNFYVRQLCNF